MNGIDISIAELRAAVDRLLNAVEEKFGSELSIPEDFYWNIQFSSATRLDKEPPLDTGSVCDDAESVREFLARDPDAHTSIWHESEHIGGLLRSISRLDVSMT